MTHGILTNQFDAVYDYEAIDRDFTIFMVTKESQKLDRINVLDIPLANWKALSVQYTYGRNAFVLFSKGSVDETAFRMQMQEQFPEVTVRKVDILDAEFREKYFYYNDRLLAQLLLNSLRIPKNPKLSYQNLTGKLFYTNADWIIKNKETKRPWMLYALEVHLSPGMYLKLNVRTFRSKTGKPQKGGREYIFDPRTKQLRRRLKEDEKPDQIFVEGSFENSRNTVDYLNIQSPQAFGKCKLGVLQQLLEDVRKRLGDYLTLTPQYRENVQSFEISTLQKQALDAKRLSSLIQRPIHLIDDAGTEHSAAMGEQIKEQLLQYYGLSVSGNTWDPQAYHIRLIHEEAYYSEQDLPDLHANVPDGMIVQHMTEEQKFESNGKKAAPALNKVLQELLIKEDVQQKTIRIFDWKALRFVETWTFVMREKIKMPFDPKRKPSYNRIGESVFDHYLYTAAAILPEGGIRFEQFRDDNDLTAQQEKVVRAYESFQTNQKKVENEVEGLVYADIGNIHAIIRTPMTTMPAIDAIRNGLENSNPKTLLEKEQLLAALVEFAEQSPEEREQSYAEMLKNKLLASDEPITKTNFRVMMDYRHFRAAAKEWNRFLHGNYGILIMPELKCEDFEELYCLENVLDIKHYACQDHLGTKEFHYFVGTKRKMLQSSLHNACIVRKVLSTGDSINFQVLLPLLAVDFVRNNQYTVLPFPFKYLREYAAMQST